MLSFMVKINKMGWIEKVFWSDPENIVSARHNSIFQLFVNDEKAAILKHIKSSSHREHAFSCGAALKLREQPAAMSLCIVSMNKGFLVFAAESRSNWDAECAGGYQAAVVLLMNMIKSCVNKAEPSLNDTPGNEQVEMIQTLMNELKDRKRQLEETNSRLNGINLDLNNRLVKDSLTGLVSRYQYRAEMEYLIGMNPGKFGVFVFIDIDDFKSVNDEYGHAAGDRYLIEFSERLKLLPIKNMVRMRISGDEFGLFAYGLDDCRSAVMEDIWNKIRHHVLAKPIQANGTLLPLAVSAGMSVYGKDTCEIYELVENADHAMYAAKRKGKNRYHVFNQSMVGG